MASESRVLSSSSWWMDHINYRFGIRRGYERTADWVCRKCIGIAGTPRACYNGKNTAKGHRVIQTGYESMFGLLISLYTESSQFSPWTELRLCINESTYIFSVVRAHFRLLSQCRVRSTGLILAQTLHLYFPSAWQLMQTTSCKYNHSLIRWSSPFSV